LLRQVPETDSVIYYTYTQDSLKSFYRGQKRYELSNHLGNVLAVITDRRIQACGAGDVMHYEAQVVSVSDYYPFGMRIKEREWSDSSFGYRFGFNGKEQDNEVSGSGNSYDYGFRIYNPRLGKFLSVDPLFRSYPWFTPYQFAANDPVRNIDIDGLEGGSAIEDEGSIIGDVLDYYVDFMAKALFNEEYETRLETFERLRQEKKTLEQPNAPAPPVKQDQSKPALKTTGADKVVNATQENSNQSSQKNVYLGNEVPFVSQFTLPRPNEACCRAAQKTLKDFGLKNSGLKSNRIIVGRDNADKSGIAIIPSAAKTGIAYINEQLDKGNPVMVGVNHTTGKGQDDGEAADHFVVITGRSTDENGATSYSFYEVATSHEDKGKSLENKLDLGSDNSLTGTNYAKKKQFTVTDIRKNGK
jgi:RHS repeat-associated protein